jgi:hypothetical protein
MSEFLCEFCNKVPVGEPKMICDKCFEDELKAQKRQEEIDEYYCEEQRKRYAHTGVLDNEIGKISVRHYRKILRSWNYTENDSFFSRSRKHTMLEAKAYLDGWLDALEATAFAVKKGMFRK